MNTRTGDCFDDGEFEQKLNLDLFCLEWRVDVGTFSAFYASSVSGQFGRTCGTYFCICTERRVGVVVNNFGFVSSHMM